MDNYDLKILTKYKDPSYEETVSGEVLTDPNYSPYELLCIKSKLKLLYQEIFKDSIITWSRSDSIMEENKILLTFRNIDGTIKKCNKEVIDKLNIKINESENLFPNYIILYSLNEISKLYDVPYWWIENVIDKIIHEILLHIKNDDNIDILCNILTVEYNEEILLIANLDKRCFTNELVDIESKLEDLIYKYYKNGVIPKNILLKFNDIDKDEFIKEFKLDEQDMLLIPTWECNYLIKDRVSFLFDRLNNIETLDIISTTNIIHFINNSINSNINILKYDDKNISISFENFENLENLMRKIGGRL